MGGEVTIWTNNLDWFWPGDQVIWDAPDGQKIEGRVLATSLKRVRIWTERGGRSVEPTKLHIVRDRAG